MHRDGKGGGGQEDNEEESLRDAFVLTGRTAPVNKLSRIRRPGESDLASRPLYPGRACAKAGPSEAFPYDMGVWCRDDRGD